MSQGVSWGGKEQRRGVIGTEGNQPAPAEAVGRLWLAGAGISKVEVNEEVTDCENQDKPRRKPQERQIAMESVPRRLAAQVCGDLHSQGTPASAKSV